VSGKLLRIEASASGVPLDDFGDAAVGQSRWLNALALSDRQEYWTFGDSGGFEPRFQGGYRAGDHAAGDSNDVAVPFLVRLAAADDDAQASDGFLQVPDAQANQLGAAEGAGKADEQQSAVPNGRKPSPCERPSLSRARRWRASSCWAQHRASAGYRGRSLASVGSGKPASLWA
jgi:hypothetical protein